MLAARDFVPLLEIDADVHFSGITLDLAVELEKLEPFGAGNPEPLLGSKDVEIIYPRILKNAHLKMKLRHKNFSIDAIGFYMADLLEKIGSSAVDAAFTPQVNEWERNRNLQLNVKALRPSSNHS